MSMTDMEIMKNVTEIGTVTAREDAVGGAGAGEGCGDEGGVNLEVDAHARSMHKEGEHQVLSTSSLLLCILCAKIILILFANEKLIHRVTDVDMAMRVTSVTINHPRRIQVISVLKRSAVSRSNQWAAKFWSLLTRGELCIPALNLVLLLGPFLWVLTYFFSFFLLLRYPLSFGTNPSIITASLYHT